MTERLPFNPDLIDAPASSRSSRTKQPLTVSQVTILVKDAIATGVPGTVHVVGEVSNFKKHSSGHLYFTLKDDGSELSCVMWRSAAAKLKFEPGDGVEVVASGAVEVFERAGRYQLYVRKLEPRGVGALDLAFRQLCDKLKKEGLFDREHKKPLPAYPERIAIVTSPTGAAISDMIQTIERRYPCVRLLVYPVRVQGDGASAEIAKAIAKINSCSSQLGGVDVVIVGRGGGSLEDLWAFNEEVVARAIFSSQIPIISAVGHEVDVTIADLVADVRAATPTAAGELVVPLLDDVKDSLAGLQSRLRRGVATEITLARERLQSAGKVAFWRDPLSVMHRRGQIVDEMSNRLDRSLAERTRLLRRRVGMLEATVQQITPYAYLLRCGSQLHDLTDRFSRQIQRRLERARLVLARATSHLNRKSPTHILSANKGQAVYSEQRLKLAARLRMRLLEARIETGESVLSALSHKSVLQRGFSITRTKKGDRIIRSIEELDDRQRVVTELADGDFEAEVVNLKQMELFE